MKERHKFLAAVYLFLLTDNKVLLSRRFNTGYMDGYFSLPAGHIEENETIKSAMMREAKEEIGIDINEKDLEIVTFMHRMGDKEYFDYFLTCYKWNETPKNCEPNKCSELLWCDIDKLHADILPYILRAVVNFKNDKKFDVWD
jgi:8-oxo-dGTP pyrophosphatase MutT (NUDIX family)